MLKKLKQPKSEGFTIIEVMIVLAIAGLIMLIVFLAVPALQRNSRNTQRKSEVSSFASALAAYSSNNNGAIPADQAGVATAYGDAKFSFYDPSKIFYTSTVPNGTPVVPGTTASATIPTGDSIIYVKGATCNGNAATLTGASARSYAIVYVIESGSTATLQCTGS